MQIQSELKSSEDGRFYAQYPTEPLHCQFARFTQSYRDRSELHYHQYPECGICLSGSGVFFVEDRIYPFSSGCVTYFPAGMLHIAQSPADNNSEWAYFWFDEQKLDTWFPVCEIITWESDVSALLTIIIHEQEKGETADASIHGLLVRALAKMLLHCREKDKNDAAAPSARTLIMPAIRQIAEDYAGTPDTAALARLCNISEASLRRAFHTVTGMSPMQYLTKIRITMAQSLLENSTLSVLEIANRCGFSVISTFNRQFLALTGVSPKQYRKRSGPDTKQKT